MDSGCSEITKQCKIPKLNDQGCGATQNTTNGQELSTVDVMKVARERFSYYISQSSGDLSDEVNNNVELIQFLLASAEKVGNKQFDRATKLLSMCDDCSPVAGNPLERVVYYFAGALRDKINQETGRTSTNVQKASKMQPLDAEEAVRRFHPAVFACQQQLPYVQIAQFTGIQAILDGVASAKRVHLIDLAIRIGINATVLMQALAVRYECPLELLKISAVATASEQSIEETGKRLLSFAQTIDLPFLFKVVMISDMKDLKEDLFEVEAGEVVAVYSPWFLTTMIHWPDRLEALMRMIRNLSPCVMVVTEMEANTYLPAFMDRFTEALLFYGALVDCFDACMDRFDPNRTIAEAMLMGHGIHNILTTEGEERTTQHMKVDVWRDFFVRFKMVETDLSASCLYQAKLIARKFACRSSCTFHMNGKCLLVGWKGTPISSISAWKFLQEEDKSSCVGSFPSVPN